MRLLWAASLRPHGGGRRERGQAEATRSVARARPPACRGRSVSQRRDPELPGLPPATTSGDAAALLHPGPAGTAVRGQRPRGLTHDGIHTAPTAGGE